ncbi:flagellar export chaperone FliS [Mariprofundus sp. EBB-1]|uniref:flagellar export chaperone FliS n=1 Tax=Mariprofundus sp. EBB-1 TaxID=2650971 RepID=UPI000EF1B0A9|nr:flagellar export chaperone FliS [Mariprofundus sp. EBB-1]RLL54353.1 flagellar export chaperone FliS [Mariprofundus sp. EBB-1]
MTGYKAYQGNQVDGATPLGLVLLTYDALYKSLGRARLGVESKDMMLESEQTARALEALIELSTSLNMEEGGEVAVNLARLYIYMNERLVSDMCSGSVVAIDETMALTQTLRDAWKGLDDRQRKPAMRSQASMGGMQTATAAYGY